MNVRRQLVGGKPPTTPSPPTPTTQNQCNPAMKNSEAQTIDTSIVCPKSGSRISGTIVRGSRTKDKKRASRAVGVLRARLR